MQEINGTMEELFSEFGLDCETMNVNSPYNVSEADLEIKAFDEQKNKIVWAKILYAIKKEKQSSFRIKLKNRKDFEMPMAGNHFIAIYRHENGKVDYTYIKDLFVGMKLVTIDGYDEVEKIEKLEDDFVYDITTETGNYYSNGILSHNTMMSHAIATTGGYALKYVASTLNRVRKIENLTEGSKITGIHMQVRNMKNKTSVPFRDCEMDLYFKDGFDSNCEYVDFLKEFSEDPRLMSLCVAGNGGTFKSEKFGWSYRGKDNFIAAIKNNEVTGWEEIKQTVQNIISHEIEGMENTADPEQEKEQNLTQEEAERLDN